MRATVLIAALLVGATFLALAPTADARNVCTQPVDAGCPGVACRYDASARAWTCVDGEPPISCTLPCVPDW